MCYLDRRVSIHIQRDKSGIFFFHLMDKVCLEVQGSTAGVVYQ